MRLNTVLGELKQFINEHDDDLVDRYNHKYTVILIAMFMFVISTKQYYGSPIVCWTPAEFKGSHTDFTNAICWNNGTYPVATSDQFHKADRSRTLPYYQWVPFILLLQVALFSIPNIVWHTYSRSTGIDVRSLGKNAYFLDRVDAKTREKTINELANHIGIVLSLKFQYNSMHNKVSIRKKLPFGRRQGNYLYIAYMIVKFLYILNIFAQLYLLDLFFHFSHYSYGMDFVKKFFKGDDYTNVEKAFPRVTFCDFYVRELGDNIHNYTVQCVLPINLYNEKFFIFLWFWLILLGLITIFSFLRWLAVWFWIYRKNMIAKYLRTHSKLGESPKEKEMLNTFVSDFCHLDGALIFALIRLNSNEITISEIVGALWSKYCKDYLSYYDSVPANARSDDDYDNKESSMIYIQDQDGFKLNKSPSTEKVVNRRQNYNKIYNKQTLNPTYTTPVKSILTDYDLNNNTSRDNSKLSECKNNLIVNNEELIIIQSEEKL